MVSASEGRGRSVGASLSAVEGLLRRVPGALARRAIMRAAPHVGIVAHYPHDDYTQHLNALTEYVESPRPVRDHRIKPTSVEGRDLTLTVDGLADALAGMPSGMRILEVGPKYGYHSLWLDEHLRPAELVFSDFASDRTLHDEWVGRLQSPHRWVYGDLRLAGELLELPPFDLVLFLGVLYHGVHHLDLLAMLNRVTRPGGTMLLETTYDRRPGALVRLRWQDKNQKAKALPTIDALRLELAWTGWRRVTRLTDYRPESDEVVLLCEKTDELPGSGTQLAPMVVRQRPDESREPSV